MKHSHSEQYRKVHTCAFFPQTACIIGVPTYSEERSFNAGRSETHVHTMTFQQPNEKAEQCYFQALPFLQEWLTYTLFIGRVRDCPEEKTLILPCIPNSKAEISCLQEIVKIPVDAVKNVQPSKFLVSSSNSRYTELLDRLHPRLSCGFLQYSLFAGAFEGDTCTTVFAAGYADTAEWKFYMFSLANYLKSLKGGEV